MEDRVKMTVHDRPKSTLACGHTEWDYGHCSHMECELYVSKCPLHAVAKTGDKCNAAVQTMVYKWQTELKALVDNYVDEHIGGGSPDLTVEEFLDDFALYLNNRRTS